LICWVLTYIYTIIYILNMSFGKQLLSWRLSKGFGQKAIAATSGLTQAYLSRIEQDQVDPSLSVLRRLAAVLNLSVGQLIEETPLPHPLTRFDLDNVARAALKPGLTNPKLKKITRILSGALTDKREAMGFYKQRGTAKSRESRKGQFALRKLRVQLGETQWKALLRRIDKFAASFGETS
jgi:transcriptional regulator with XRE-family HTH domain